MVEIPCAQCGKPVDASGGECPECGFRQMTAPWAVFHLLRQLWAPFAAAITWGVLTFIWPGIFGSGVIALLFVLGVAGLVVYNVVVTLYRFGRRRKLIREAKAAQSGDGTDATPEPSGSESATRPADDPAVAGDGDADDTDEPHADDDAGEGDADDHHEPEADAASPGTDPIAAADEFHPVFLEAPEPVEAPEDAGPLEVLRRAPVDAPLGAIEDRAVDLGIYGSVGDAARYELSTAIDRTTLREAADDGVLTDPEGVDAVVLHVPGEAGGHAALFEAEAVVLAPPDGDLDAVREAVEDALGRSGAGA